MRKTWIALLFALCFLAIASPAFADDDDSSSSSGSSGGDGTESSTPDEVVQRTPARNDLVFDISDRTAPVFSKSNETYRAPSSVADSEQNRLNK